MVLVVEGQVEVEVPSRVAARCEELKLGLVVQWRVREMRIQLLCLSFAGVVFGGRIGSNGDERHFRPRSRFVRPVHLVRSDPIWMKMARGSPYPHARVYVLVRPPLLSRPIEIPSRCPWHDAAELVIAAASGEGVVLAAQAPAGCAAADLSMCGFLGEAFVLRRVGDAPGEVVVVEVEVAVGFELGDHPVEGEFGEVFIEDGAACF